MTGSRPRNSLHVEPNGLHEMAQHYLRDLVYGAHDGLITTFAVVAAVTGGALAPYTVLIVGTANLLADGLSMGVGNYLGIRSQEGARAAQDLPEEEASPARHGLAIFCAFVVAGAMPLLPYLFSGLREDAFFLSATLTLATLFIVGVARSLVTVDRWWVSGLEMFGLGLVVAGVAYAAGALANLALSGAAAS